MGHRELQDVPLVDDGHQYKKPTKLCWLPVDLFISQARILPILWCNHHNTMKILQYDHEIKHIYNFFFLSLFQN